MENFVVTPPSMSKTRGNGYNRINLQKGSVAIKDELIIAQKSNRAEALRIDDGEDTVPNTAELKKKINAGVTKSFESNEIMSHGTEIDHKSSIMI